MKIKQDEMRVGELFKGIPDFVRVFQEIGVGFSHLERDFHRTNHPLVVGEVAAVVISFVHLAELRAQ